MPWLVRDVVRDINKAAGRRWQELDPLLPEPYDLAVSCAEPFVASGRGGRPAGFAVCRHDQFPDNSLSQTWGTKSRFVLAIRLRDKDTRLAADELIGQWRDHLAALPDAHKDDTSALVNWPSRDTSGVLALLRHGLQAMTVLAARPAGRATPAGGGVPAGVVIRPAVLTDLASVGAMELGVIRYDEQFGGAFWRANTEDLIRTESRAALENCSAWMWIAERSGQAVGLVTALPPASSAWIANMTRPAPAAYLSTMYVVPGERGTGIAAALVRQVHAELDAHGVAVTLLHHSIVNPLSGPFWNRMGYRPLWTSWEARPAAALR
ncbi:MAG TPA: GNAT family N-acetyltransferase [Streptosporangiaceae bacterium]|nr:GNAT family N-acetyltransferase [Streptosporangiaceae bacterium]